MSSRVLPALERIAVGVDMTDSSLEAARWARRTLAPGAELLLIHAIEDGASHALLGGQARPAPTSLETRLELARERLAEVMTGCDPELTRPFVRAGTPAVVVATVAEETGADMIVVGPHDDQQAPWSRLGSTAERLIRGSPVPVTLGAGPMKVRPRRLLVAVDDGDLTPTVLAWAALLARRWHATIVLANCVVSDQPGDRKELSDAAQDGALSSTLEWLGRLSTDLPTGIPVEREVLWGRPGEAILEAVDRLAVDVIVMGRRGAGRALPGVIGTTSSTVLRGAPCPVVVIVDPPFAVIDAW